MNPTKILFVIPSLVAGGAEKIFVELVNHIDRARFQPLVALFEKEGVYLDSLAEDIPVFHLKKRGRFSFFRLIMRLAGLVRREKVEVVLASMEYANIISLLARKMLRRGPEVIATVHIDPAFIPRTHRFGKIKYFLHNWLYPSAAIVIAVSKGVKKGIHDLYSIPDRQVRVIYNGVNHERIARAVSETDGARAGFRKVKPLILTCGRLDPQKNYPLLIRAFRMVADQVDADLIILGEGSQRNILEALVKDLGLLDRVVLPGYKSNPYYYIGRSDVFALSSDAEGFANVIIEAMACGIPVVSTRCPYGPEEIIHHGENGFLVPVGDPRNLADTILALLRDEGLRKTMGAAASASAKNFTIDKMVGEYEDVFAGMARRDDSSPAPTVTP